MTNPRGADAVASTPRRGTARFATLGREPGRTVTDLSTSDSRARTTCSQVREVRASEDTGDRLAGRGDESAAVVTRSLAVEEVTRAEDRPALTGRRNSETRRAWSDTACPCLRTVDAPPSGLASWRARPDDRHTIARSRRTGTEESWRMKVTVGRCHRFQPHEEGHVHRLVEGDAVRRVDVAGTAASGDRADRRQGLRDPLPDVALALHPGRLQLVETDATRHGGQPGCG